MHEVSLVEQLIEECVRRAGDGKVRTVSVRHASTIPADGLRQAFEMLTHDGPLAGAVLETQEFEVELDCPCGFRGRLAHDDVISGSVVVCPACGDVRTTPRTAELELIALS